MPLILAELSSKFKPAKEKEALPSLTDVIDAIFCMDICPEYKNSTVGRIGFQSAIHATNRIKSSLGQSKCGLGIGCKPAWLSQIKVGLLIRWSCVRITHSPPKNTMT